MSDSWFASARIKTALVCVTLCIAVVTAAKAAEFMGWYAVRDYQLEYREYAVVLTTELLLAGKNPFSLEVQPFGINVYGIFYHLITLPLAATFGCTLVVHRIVSCFFIVMTCLCLLWGLRAGGVSWSSSLVAVCILFADAATGVGIAARPDSLGHFLFLASLVVPFVLHYSPAGLAASVMLAMLGFITKPYFVLGAPFLAGYLFLFESKRKGLLYALGFAVAFSAVLVLVQVTSEAYFTNTVFIHINFNTNSLEHLQVQLTRFAATYSGFIVSIVVAALLWARASLNRLPGREGGEALIDVRCLRNPLIMFKVELPEYLLASGLALILCRMGRHTGNGQLYYLQVVTPFLLWVMTRAVDYLRNTSHWSLLLPVLFNVVLIHQVFLFYDYDQKPYRDQSSQWQALEEVIARHKDVYHAPGLAYVVTKLGRPVYDTGQNEYYIGGRRHNFSPGVDDYMKRGKEFWGTIAERAKLREFDLVIQLDGVSWPLDRKILKENYILVGHMPMPLLFNGTWQLELWNPKP